MNRSDQKRTHFSRRQFLKNAALLSGMSLVNDIIHPNWSWALGQDSQFDVAELQLGSNLSRPSAWVRGLFEVARSTSIETNPKSTLVNPESVDLFDHPFAILVGDSAFEPLSNLGIENLRRYLVYGGFLFVDDASGRVDSPFSQSVQRMCRRLFPMNPMVDLSSDHSVYRSFFLLNQPTGRVQVSEQMQGIQVNSIFPLIYNCNDLSGALMTTESGDFRYMPVPDGEFQRRESIKLFINLVLYALTSNYKHDQVHVAELLRRGGL